MTSLPTTSLDDCRVSLADDVLVLENSRIVRRFQFNQGHLATLDITDRRTGHAWSAPKPHPDAVFPGEAAQPTEGAVVVDTVPAGLAAAHLRVTVTSCLGSLHVRRVFRLYRDCPAIACDWALRGVAAGDWLAPLLGAQDPARPPTDNPARPVANVVTDRLPFAQIHQRFTAVRFYDITDLRNNLVEAHSVLGYRNPMPLIGNILFVDDLLSGDTTFILREAPCSDVQLGSPGFDFLAGPSDARVVGAGLLPSDLHPEHWTRGYGVVVGVCGAPAEQRELARLEALRAYQYASRSLRPDRDHMIMLNTWGDRSQDKRLGEPFALAELSAAARLGVSHFQLDDGWQQGRSLNSAFQNGVGVEAARPPAFWAVHPERFPRSLEPVTRRARELGIELGLWFEPTAHDDYALWEQDAQTLLGLLREHGIRTFKIDAVKITSRRCETNLRALLDTVMAATQGQAVFNLDVTAGRRFGYHYFNEYGNKFLENRYTDWSNYYPHWTLRNLWMLARYVPPQSLQIEFLNTWRNRDRYHEDDPYAPGRIPFAWAFAVTMAAQPLAWFEASNLPEEAFDIAPLVRTYRQHQHALHAGRIYPVGEEPCGSAWTGLQSINDDRGYLLLYRERNDRTHANVKLWGMADRHVRFTALAGSAVDVEHHCDKASTVPFVLPRSWAFAFYQYQFI